MTTLTRTSKKSTYLISCLLLNPFTKSTPIYIFSACVTVFPILPRSMLGTSLHFLVPIVCILWEIVIERVAFAYQINVNPVLAIRLVVCFWTRCSMCLPVIYGLFMLSLSAFSLGSRRQRRQILTVHNSANDLHPQSRLTKTISLKQKCQSHCLECQIFFTHEMCTNPTHFYLNLVWVFGPNSRLCNWLFMHCSGIRRGTSLCDACKWRCQNENVACT